MPKVTHFLLYSLCAALLSSCASPQQDQLLVLSGVTMGTVYQIKVNAPGAKAQRGRIQLGIARILDHIDRSMSTYNPDSELSAINRDRTTSWLPVSDDLYQVLDDAQRISRLTSGAFDITVGPLVNLWGFGPEHAPGAIPPDQEVRARLALSGFRKLELRPSPRSISRKIPGMYIDLSGIAKGYGVDKVAEYLQGLSFSNYLVDIGGEVRVRGINAHGEAWNIGIERPIAGQRSIERIMPLRNTAMATSGDYRNFFEINGKRYSHTIDPNTGRPVTHNLVSVTVLNPSTASADALATGMLVLGLERALELAAQHHIAALLITRGHNGFREHETPAFTAYLKGALVPAAD